MEVGFIMDKNKVNPEKPSVDDYSGIILNLFNSQISSIKKILEERNFKITQEALFIASILAYILVEVYWNKAAKFLLSFLIILLIFNLIIPNFQKIRNFFFKTKAEKFKGVFKNNLQDNLVELKLYVQNS